MISKTYILANLRRLDAAYSQSTHQKHAFYFSKLAILELCGWIEMSMDDIVMCHCRRNVREQKYRDYVQRQIVDRTYGFDYERHFKSMLIRLVGVIAFEKIERNISVPVQTRFIAELGNLKSLRDGLAHTYAKHVPMIDAPSTTTGRFTSLYAGLKAYDDALRSR
ncbi:hypothetical protein [Sphingopyxis sp.]|uniref:hypothetical protein n=1 Tax=Sphingopyxis sp. TaxID=1908224 RepID=UPI003D127F73